MRRAPFVTRAVVIGTLLHVYIGLRLLPAGADWLARAAPWPWAAAAWGAGGTLILLLSCGLIPLAMRNRLPQPQADRLAWAGLLLMGFFSSLFVLTLLRDVMLLLAWLGAQATGWPLPGALNGISALAVAALALLASVKGFFNARRRAPVKTVNVPVAALPQALHGFTIAQVSDLHVGPTIKRPYVQAVVDAVNALQADVVALTGDIVDGKLAHLAQDARPLGDLRARHGVYLVTGNHEYYCGVDDWLVQFKQLGLNVLMNRHVVIVHQGARLVLAGVTDYGAAAFDAGHRSDPLGAIAGAPPDVPLRILLAHQPRSAVAARRAGYTLQLSGHTHGGQFLPWNFFVRLQQPFTSGLRRLGDLWVYTSRGTGYWGPPMRLGAPSEISLVRLIPG